MLNEKFWAKYFKVYDVLNEAIPYQELLQSICDELEIKKEDKILEAGSGTGNLAIAIKKRGGIPTAIDNVKEALKRHQEKDNEADVVFGNLTETLPFPDNYFDKVCSNNVLYAITKDRRNGILEEFYRVLKPGGKIVLSNLHRDFKATAVYKDHLKKYYQKKGLFETIRRILNMIIPTLKIFYYNAKIKKEHSVGEFNFVKIKEQERLLKDNGFENISEEKLVYAQQGILISGEKI